MPLFSLKSLLALPLLVCALTAMYTMFEIFGRGEPRHDAARLRKIHRVNGIIYFLLYLFIAYLCLDFLARTRAEPSPRAAFHGVFSLSIALLLLLKVICVRYYRGYYQQAKVLGLLVALLTFAAAGTSAGYYLLVRGFGPEEAGPATEAVSPSVSPPAVAVRTDEESIRRGRKLYESKCTPCHDPGSAETIIGPGHKGLMKNPGLPASGRPATPGNIARQLREPYRRMPSFAYLSGNEVEDLIAYLHTL